MTPEQLDNIEARAEAAADGPWERGDVWQWAGVMPEMFGEGRCGFCNRCGEPVWIGEADINGAQMLAHKHRAPEPYAADHWISNEHGLVVGPVDYETGGVIDPADTEFITSARTDIPALVSEVRRLRSAVDYIGPGMRVSPENDAATVDQVARAIHDSAQQDEPKWTDWDQRSEEIRDYWRLYARAALAAMNARAALDPKE